MNYYAEMNCCRKCNRSDRLHIGKKSAGWEFMFQGYPHLGIRSWENWKNKLADDLTSFVYDENGKEIELGELGRIVVRSKGDKNHNDYHPRDGFKDPEGYSFSDGDFS